MAVPLDWAKAFAQKINRAKAEISRLVSDISRLAGNKRRFISNILWRQNYKLKSPVIVVDGGFNNEVKES